MGLFGRSEPPKEEVPTPAPVPALPPAAQIAEPEQTSAKIITTSDLPQPPKFDDFSKEARSALSMMEMFDGFKFDLHKGLSEDPTPFYSSHSISMGSVSEPPSYNYSLSLKLGKCQLAGRIDTDGHVQGRLNCAISDNIAFNSMAQANPEPHSSGISSELELKGSYWQGGFKWANNGMYNLSYMQSITPSLSLGMETVYQHKQGMALMAFGGRYETEKSVISAGLLAGQLVTSYTQKLSSRINLSTELSVIPMNTGVETTCSAGFEYNLRTSQLKARVDTSGKVGCYVEELLSPVTKFLICAELDHKKKNYRFGFGAQMQV